METGLTANEIVTELTKSVHGDLKQYVPVGRQAVRQNPEFFAHFIAWNHAHGEVRDAAQALPAIALSEPADDKHNVDFMLNALAGMALLDPRSLLRSVKFAMELRNPAEASYGRAIRNTVTRYLRAREEFPGWLERSALQHKRSMRALYTMHHIKPSPLANSMIVRGDHVKGTVFHDVGQLRNMDPVTAAGTILNRRIPFLVARGAMGKAMEDESLLLALITGMTPAELVTNASVLERAGVLKKPALRGAFDAALGRAGQSKRKGTTLKATRAQGGLIHAAVPVAGMRSSPMGAEMRTKLRVVQEKQIMRLGGIDGDWLVMADKSGSMREAIKSGRLIAATLAKFVKGKVHLIFFDTTPRYVDATGLTLDELLEKTKHMMGDGGTSIGCPLVYMRDKGFKVDGIAIVTDAAENEPPKFVTEFQRYTEKIGKDIPVYLYRMKLEDPPPGYRHSPYDVDLAHSMRASGLDLQEFDLRGGVDYYSLPNLVQTMRANRYSLEEAIMETPLLSLEDALKRKDEVA